MSLHSTNYTGYHAGQHALDVLRPWQVIRKVQPHDTALGEVISQHATKRGAIAAILDMEAKRMQREAVKA